TRRGGLLSSLASLSAGCGLKMQHEVEDRLNATIPDKTHAYSDEWSKPEASRESKPKVLAARSHSSLNYFSLFTYYFLHVPAERPNKKSPFDDNFPAENLRGGVFCLNLQEPKHLQP
ncbi:hypothetical protein, partial [uncultured Alistipes sp.]|uniref:hypothetical protein n=1 Tax=uncultured Alistipes sp. TaxID=538949 RepID=UPI00262183D1